VLPKWITREKVKVDRVACPWLIKKFIDSDAITGSQKYKTSHKGVFCGFAWRKSR
jgi:hypothetical protein